MNSLIIDVALVRKLIDSQFPQWKHLEIKPVAHGGWDNRTFHLGDTMLVRMPSAAEYAEKVAIEQRWLPILAPLLPLQIPTPLEMGRPAHGYPWHWSVYHWIEGDSAAQVQITDPITFAKDLADFLVALHKINPHNGPMPGSHNFYRGGSLKVYDTQTRQAIEKLKNKIDVTAATQIWETALATRWNKPPVWVHGDISLANLLIHDDILIAVIDFGGMAVGDPACDLAIAWTFFTGESRKVFRTAINLDEATWARARAWALWKAIIVAAGICETNNIEGRECWQIIDELITDYKQNKDSKQSHFPSDKHIIECLNVDYGIEAHSITPVYQGADITAALYKVQAQNQASYFVKLKHGYENESNLTLLELLYTSGIQQIIPPVKTIHGHSILPLGDFCLIVYPFIEGVNGFSRKLTDAQWITLGKVLRRIHDFDVPSSLLKHIRKETYSPQWRQAVRSFYATIDDRPRSNDDIALKFLNFMKEHRLVIQSLVDRADQLAHTVQKQSPQLVLCHSDVHAGNVLITKNDTFYIVDWDEPIMAPKERDLMFIGGGVGNVWNDPQEMAYFYKGYGNTPINSSILAYYRYERIVQDIAEYIQIFLKQNLDTSHKNKLEMYNHFTSMFDPQGVVDIAFKTDQQG
jgi:spectinomycin phosphotransferase